MFWSIRGSAEKGGIISAWLVLNQGPGLGWVEVALLMAFELKGVFTGVEGVLRQRKQDVMKYAMKHGRIWRRVSRTQVVE